MTNPRTPALPSAMAALLAVMVTAGAAAAQSGAPRVAILVYDGVQVIDHAIPYEVFGQFSLSDVYTVAPDTGEVRTFMGLRILPHYTFADAPEPDLLVLPGGDTREARTDPEIVEWVRSTATSSTHVLTVCTGVFFLVGSDLLEGARITTWYDQQEALRQAAPEAEVVSDAIVVDAGKLVTAAGTGIEGALHVLGKLHGPAWREAVRLNMEHQGVPEHLHVPRASLADVNLPSAIYGAFPWREAEFVRYEGDEDRWTSEWIFEAATPPDALRARIAAALRDEDGWEPEEDEGQAHGWTSRWALEGRDGGPWEGRVRLREEGDGYRLEIEVRRSAGDSGTSLDLTRVTSGAAVTDAYSSPSASWVDIDGDGDEDLYVLNGYGSLEEEPRPQPDALYLNDGAGGLTPDPNHPLVEDVTFSGGATWGDWDNDGDPDLFVANQRGADNFLYRNDGGGSFSRLTDGPVANDGGRSFSAVWVDVDGDGLLDLHVLNGRDGDGGEVDYFYRNLGDGTFERRTGLPFAREALRSGGGAWADFDRDGDPDLLLPVYEAGQGPRLYRNDGDFRFTEITDEAGLAPDPLPFWPAASVAWWVDYDSDGDLDLYLGTTGGNADFLFANEGDGTFERVVAGRVGLDATYVSDALWADLDNDGDLDLLLAVWGGASEIYLNDGEGRLHPAEADGFGEMVTFASSASAADIDGDGDLDPYLTQWPINRAGGAPNLLYRNDGPAGNWLKIELEGRESNRSAIGARITVTAKIEGEARRQLRHVNSRSSWRSSNSLTQHFGLGDAGGVDRIEVAWPSGHADTLEGPIPANRCVRIDEGVGSPRVHPPRTEFCGEER